MAEIWNLISDTRNGCIAEQYWYWHMFIEFFARVVGNMCILGSLGDIFLASKVTAEN